MEDAQLRTHRRVGAVALVASGLLVLWMVVGPHGSPWQDRAYVYASFDQIGALLPGANVRLGGKNIGTVTEIGAAPPPATRRWRVTMSVDADVLALVAQNSLAIITPQGVLGKPMLELAPPREAPVSNLAAMRPPTLQGVDPASLDRTLERLYNHSGLMLAVRDELRPDAMRLRVALEAIEDEVAQTAPPAREDAALAWATMRRARAYAAALAEPLADTQASWHLARAAWERAMAARSPQLTGLRAELALGTSRLRDGDRLARARLAAMLGNVGDAVDHARWLIANGRGLLADAEHGTLLRLLNDPELYDLFKLFAEQNTNAPWRLIGHPDDQAFDREAWRKQFDIAK
ncbi:MAG: MCE family protein [Myxococcales bacterium]|nr:MCE family protein [Myxococcales bacterium]